MALHITTKNRHGAVMRLLFKNNANVDSENKYGLILLISVVENGHKIVMWLLFKNNVNMIILN